MNITLTPKRGDLVLVRRPSGRTVWAVVSEGVLNRFPHHLSAGALHEDDLFMAPHREVKDIITMREISRACSAYLAENDGDCEDFNPQIYGGLIVCGPTTGEWAEDCTVLTRVPSQIGTLTVAVRN